MRQSTALLCLLFSLLGFTKVTLAAPRVLVTVKPIYGLVASIMQDVATPELLLPDYASPHTFQLKPSNYQQLHQADLIIWVGPDLETFLIDPLAQLHPRYGIIALEKLPGITRLAPRQGRSWQNNEANHDHAHEQIDPHLWLSVENAQVIVNAITATLTKIDPNHAQQYQHNATLLQDRLVKLKTTLHTLLHDVQQQPFLVYHDGYQYFEKEFGLHGVGTMVINPQLPLSAKGLQEIGQLIKTNNVRCVFRETEFNDSQIQKSLQHWQVNVVEIDPLGAKQAKDPHAYEATLLELGNRFRECLKPQKDS